MEAIVISTSRRQLELFDGQRLIRRYPIAVGKAQTPTPHGRFTIATKTMHPGGVFGSRWLGLSLPRYGIHGTNQPDSIGQAISKGCIRMHNRDVEQLYERVKAGTPVFIRG
ncbi:MAG: L,D-transpeptidase [Peptococcaceae bacterium]|nr:L,D-transpeptidase [Peptococcaceae bacterium]